MTRTELEALRRGDVEFFRDAVDTHSGRLLAYARGYAPDDASAEDLVQETWLRAYRKRESFRAEGSFVGWLLAIARSVALDHDRKSAVRIKRLAAAPVGPVAEVPAADEAMQRSDRLRTALAQLPPRQRDTVVLRILEDRSIRESAEILGVAEGTVKATLHRAIHNLRTLITSDPREGTS